MNIHSSVKKGTILGKKVQILEATERLLAKHGFEHLSMQLVAKEANVAAGTIYRYFSDKNDLLQQLRLHVMTQCANRLLVNVNLNQIDKTQFSILWKNAWDFTFNRDDNAINREQFDSLPYHTNPEQKQIELAIFAPIDAFFRQGVESGLFKPFASCVLTSMTIEPAICLAKKQARNMISLSALDIEQIIDACWDAISLNKNKSEHL
jgi:TetR/AcrR family transcriptional repressor of multidrug resistance operon